MTLSRARQSVSPGHDRGSADSTVVLIDNDGRLSAAASGRPRIWDHAIAARRSLSLDARLAAGMSPDSDRLMAVRACKLVRPSTRKQLATDWDRLLQTARTRRPGSLVLMMCRDRIIAAEPEIRQLQDALRAPLPVPARGVAMANRLLVDGTGPVHNRRSDIDLRGALQEAIRELDPTAQLWQAPAR